MAISKILDFSAGSKFAIKLPQDTRYDRDSQNCDWVLFSVTPLLNLADSLLTDIQIDWFRNADMPSKADIQIETKFLSQFLFMVTAEIWEVIVPGTCAHSNGNGTNEILESEQNFWGRNKNFWDRFWSNVVHRGRVKTCHKQLYAYEIAYNWLTDYFQVT